MTAEDIVRMNGQHGKFSFATQFLSRPFLYQGFKLNIRQFLLPVCTPHGLLAFVHDSGRAYYTPATYAEPWVLDKDQDPFKHLITTVTAGVGDKPISTDEIYFHTGVNHTLFQRSMHARLALAVHASRSGEHDLCAVDSDYLKLTDAQAVPSCLKQAVRTQVFGCDFHVDEDFTGYESRLFECNKNPGMVLKSAGARSTDFYRPIKVDMISFLGFEGEFDGSIENAEKNNMHLIYDSQSFDPKATLAFLHSLQLAGNGKTIEDHEEL